MLRTCTGNSGIRSFSYINFTISRYRLKNPYNIIVKLQTNEFFSPLVIKLKKNSPPFKEKKNS